MDSTIFHNSLLAVLIGSFLVFIVCVLCIGAASDRGLCCRDATSRDGYSPHISSKKAEYTECICEKGSATHLTLSIPSNGIHPTSHQTANSKPELGSTVGISSSNSSSSTATTTTTTVIASPRITVGNTNITSTVISSSTPVTSDDDPFLLQDEDDEDDDAQHIFSRHFDSVV